MRVGLVVPHIFMHKDILPKVIFSPGELALSLADGLVQAGMEVSLFTPGPVTTSATNVTADLSGFETELAVRGDTYTDLLKKHPFTFVSLARQVQSELIAKAYRMANADHLDVVHIYTNEEDTALPFADLCNRPVVFTHHDPFNFLVKYKSVFPKYHGRNWFSLSYAQRSAMPKNTNWVGNIYHGMDETALTPVNQPSNDYIAYLGRIIEPKGVHLAIQAVRGYNKTNAQPLTLRVAGKHYSGQKKDAYWNTKILPEVDNKTVFYDGHIVSSDQKRAFLANASALIVPSTFDEPFGMVLIEALACGTPVIGIDSGAIPEVINNNHTGIIARKAMKNHSNPKRKTAKVVDEAKTTVNLVAALGKINTIDRAACRTEFEQRFTLKRMCSEHILVYEELIRSS